MFSLYFSERFYYMSYTCHSGGCPGADMFWEDEGNKYGVNTIAYSFWGHTQYGKNRQILEREQLDEGFEAVKLAAKSIGRSPMVKWPYVKNLLCRNWFQVKNSDAVFAIGKFLGTENRLVSGGTGWAVQMAIDNNKPVYLFDQICGNWNRYDYTTRRFEWTFDEIPKLTQNFAGVGTRELQENGKEAIRQIYKNNFRGEEEQQTRVPVTDQIAGAAPVTPANVI